MIGFVVSETGRLDGSAVRGSFSAAYVVGIAGSTSPGIGDAGHSIAARLVSGGRQIAGCVRTLDGTSGKVGFNRRDIASGVSLFRPVDAPLSVDIRRDRFLFQNGT